MQADSCSFRALHNFNGITYLSTDFLIGNITFQEKLNGQKYPEKNSTNQDSFLVATTPHYP